MDDFNGRHAAVREIEFDMVDALLGEVSSLVCLVVQPDNAPNLQLFEDGHIIIGREGAVLHGRNGTLYLSTGLSEGELKAMNLLGMIQFRSPFSIF